MLGTRFQLIRFLQTPVPIQFLEQVLCLPRITMPLRSKPVGFKFGCKWSRLLSICFHLVHKDTFKNIILNTHIS